MLAIGLCRCCLSSWGSSPLVLAFWAFFKSWMGAEFCQIFLLHQLIWAHDFSSLACLYSGLYWFRILNQPCIAGINPTCPWCITVFICAGFNLLIVCWELAHVYSCGILLCSFLFLYWLWLVLVSGWCWPHKLSWEGVHLPFSGRNWWYWCRSIYT